MVEVNGSNNNVNWNTFKVDLKKTSLTSNREKSIFQKLDTNNDGKLSQTELNSIVTGKVKNSKGEFVDCKFIKVKDLGQGRTLVQNAAGKEFVMAKDGVILKSDYASKVTNGAVKNTNQKTGSQKTVYQLNKSLKEATNSFNKQLENDGWAGDLADGVSALWGSKNRASKVRADIAKQTEYNNELAKAGQKGEEFFKVKFKQIYGVEYNQQAIDNYYKKPTAGNYKNAFGTKVPDIKTRVKEYNESQQTGATAIKTTAKVAAGVTVGVMTGGTGLVALGAAAAATGASAIIVDETDRANITGNYTDAKGKTVKTEGTFKKGTDHKKILKDAAWDSASTLAGGAVGKVAGATIKGATKMATVGRASANVAGDVTLGAAREYTENGEVTATGVLSNAAMSGVGSAITSGVFKVGGKVFNGIKRGFDSADNATSSQVSASFQYKQYKVKSKTSQTTLQRTQTSSTTSSNDAGIVIVKKRSTPKPSQTTPSATSSNDAGIVIVKKHSTSEPSQTTPSAAKSTVASTNATTHQSTQRVIQQKNTYVAETQKTPTGKKTVWAKKETPTSVDTSKPIDLNTGAVEIITPRSSAMSKPYDTRIEAQHGSKVELRTNHRTYQSAKTTLAEGASTVRNGHIIQNNGQDKVSVSKVDAHEEFQAKKTEALNATKESQRYQNVQNNIPIESGVYSEVILGKINGLNARVHTNIYPGGAHIEVTTIDRLAANGKKVYHDVVLKPGQSFTMDNGVILKYNNGKIFADNVPSSVTPQNPRLGGTKGHVDKDFDKKPGYRESLDKPHLDSTTKLWTKDMDKTVYLGANNEYMLDNFDGEIVVTKIGGKPHYLELGEKYKLPNGITIWHKSNVSVEVIQPKEIS